MNEHAARRPRKGIAALQMMVCTLQGRCARLHGRLKALPGARVLP